MKKNPVVHFELPYDDKERMVEFYAKSFGWTANMLGAEYGGYVTVMTSEADEKGFPKERGMINGGFYKKEADKPAQYPSVVISVNDIEDAMEKIAKAGGKVLGEPWDIPEVGPYVSFIDTEGNRVAILQPKMKM
ncbi:MAG: VOC family protein [Candidatus Moranbacteria bacterium]|nr:VOC family protein [Candidatus Moranbacteria bacterium]